MSKAQLPIEQQVDLVVNELKVLAPNPASFQTPEAELKSLVTMPKNNQFLEECIRVLIKTYTAESCY